MAFEHNDIATKNRLMSGLGEEIMGFEHNDIVTVDVMEKAIAEGGGGGGDFSTAQVTISAFPAHSRFYAPLLVDAYEKTVAGNSVDSVGTYTVILHDGIAMGEAISLDFDSLIITVVDGDAEADDESVTITGDCTISIAVDE